MALINCPKCGNEVSDKAVKCPQCGMQLKEIQKIVCQECGEELAENENTCHKCGCPVISENENEHKRKKNPLNKKKIVIATVAIIAVIAFGVIFQKKSAEKERLQALEDYEINLSFVSSSMLVGASTAEKAGGLIHDVWYNTIYEKADSSTDKYTHGSYGFNGDFNKSLQNLFSDTSFQSDISSIEKNQETVKEIMKELKNPPEEYKEAYEAIKEYYDAYLDLTNLVVNPTGSLQTYTSDFNDADSAVAKCYKAMSIYIE